MALGPVVKIRSQCFWNVHSLASSPRVHGSTDALKEKLLYLYENPKAAPNLGMQARKKVEQGFTWSDHGDRIAHVYRGILDRGGVGTPHETVKNVTTARVERSIDGSIEGS